MASELRTDRGIVILAGGKASRVEGVSKCYVPINDVPNMHRTLRLLRGLCAWEVQTVREHSNMDPALIYPEPTMGKSIRSACSFSECASWAVLLGDVVWDPAELGQVLALDPGEVAYHAENRFTGKRYEEHLGCVIETRHLLDVGTVAALRELPKRAHFNRVHLSGWSDDLDTPEDLAIRLPILAELARTADRGEP